LYGDADVEDSLADLNIDQAVEAAVDEEWYDGADTGSGDTGGGDTGSGDTGDANTSAGKVVIDRRPTAGCLTPPTTDISAEIVLIITSLGSFRGMYFSSERAKHLLNCKGVVYYVIDINRDVSDGADLCDQQLVDAWKEQNILMKDAASTDPSAIQIPQVVVDGIAIGDNTMLQDMEEDGDLDWIFARAACPACLNEKNPDDLSCPTCNTPYQMLVPEEKVQQMQVQQIYRGANYGATELNSLFSSSAGCHRPSVTYEGLFGEPPDPSDEA